MELKVGALILVAVGLLATFVVVMGGMSFQPSFRVYIDFDNPGGLASGANIRLSGVKVGRVEEIQFRGGLVDRKTGQPEPTIRVVADIENQYQKAIYDDSRWFVTSQGVLGEMFLAIEPGSHDRPPIADGAIVRGVSPPRLDLLLSESYELLHKAYIGITKNEKQIADIFDGLHKTLTHSGNFLEKNQAKFDRIVDNVETLSEDANETLQAARERYVDGPQVIRILNQIERTTRELDSQLGPLLGESQQLVADARRITSTLAEQQQLARYQNILRDLEETAGRVKAAAKDTRALVAHVRRGQGTVGALVMDEALYDDLQEMLRDLKHNPWKFFWRQ